MSWIDTLIAGAAGVTGVLIGSRMTRATQQWAVAAEVEARRKDSLTEALGTARTLAIEADPTRVSMNANPETPKQLTHLNGRWAVIQPTFEGASVAHSNESVRNAATDLVVGMAWLLHWDGWMINDLLAGHNFTTDLEQARSAHAKVMTAVDRIGERLRGMT